MHLNINSLPEIMFANDHAPTEYDRNYDVVFINPVFPKQADRIIKEIVSATANPDRMNREVPIIGRTQEMIGIYKSDFTEEKILRNIVALVILRFTNKSTAGYTRNIRQSLDIWIERHQTKTKSNDVYVDWDKARAICNYLIADNDSAKNKLKVHFRIAKKYLTKKYDFKEKE